MKGNDSTCRRRPWFRSGCAALGLYCLTGVSGSAQPTNVVLTNASAILALTSDRTFGQPVLIVGVVTAAQPDREWGGRFFIQDATAGVFVENISTNQPLPGDVLEVSGVSHPGGYAPIITKPQWRKLGTAALPAARPVRIEQLMAGIEDSQRVEISGIVRAYRTGDTVTVFEMASGGYRLDVHTPHLPDVDPQTLIGAQVRVRGTAATFFSAKLRHLITVSLHTPQAEDFLVEQVEKSDPFADRVVPLDHLAQYRSDHEVGKRVHVKGVVTYQRPGEDLFLQDATGGMQVKSRLTDEVAPGDVVEAVGFPSFEQYLPVLQDAIFRKVTAPRQAPVPKAVMLVELQGGYRHADFVTLQGRVLDSADRSVITPNRAQGGHRTILTVQSSDSLFSVEGPVTRSGERPMAVPVGSFVEASGICLTKISEDGKLQSLQILLPARDYLRVLEKPSWWTPKRLVLGLTGSFTVLVVAFSWIVMISRKNATLKTLVLEKEQAQVGLQHANDRLEERVRERSEQLKLQINARKDAEVQFKAVLNERTRLAQELHDTLEQTLTGIALQMDTASRFAANDRQRADHHFELARNLVTQSQAEVRCSVWDLRSHSPEQLDLAGLVLAISRKLTEDTSIKVAVNTVGRVRPLSELIEENLLRVSQEALTNIIKHSRATQATITLDYGPQNVVLTITDNGVGFDVARQAGPREGHFGLLGITERVNRLHGEVAITSAADAGTVLRATIPISPPAAAGVVTIQPGAKL